MTLIPAARRPMLGVPAERRSSNEQGTGVRYRSMTTAVTPRPCQLSSSCPRHSMAIGACSATTASHRRVRAHVPSRRPYGDESIAQSGRCRGAARSAAPSSVPRMPSSAGDGQPAQRAGFVLELATAIEGRANDFAVLDAVGGGAPVGVLLRDVQMAIESLRYFASWRWRPRATPPPGAVTSTTERRSYGMARKTILWPATPSC